MFYIVILQWYDNCDETLKIQGNSMLSYLLGYFDIECYCMQLIILFEVYSGFYLCSLLFFFFKLSILFQFLGVVAYKVPSA